MYQVRSVTTPYLLHYYRAITNVKYQDNGSDGDDDDDDNDDYDHLNDNRPAMSIPSYASKRRRLNEDASATASALSRPFKSPLKAANTNQLEEADANLPTNSRPLTSCPTRTAVRNPAPQNHPSDPEFLALQKQHSALHLQLRQLRQSLDTAQQALKLESSPTTATNLENLIRKWKLASREAAEEVFHTAKERVDRMGGMEAWRAQSRHEPSGWHDPGAAEHPDREEGWTNEQKEELEIQKQDWETERRKYAPEQDKSADEEAVSDDDVSDRTPRQLPLPPHLPRSKNPEHGRSARIDCFMELNDSTNDSETNPAA
jgi:Swi5-dependent recombination DNA repair protein 1